MQKGAQPLADISHDDQKTSPDPAPAVIIVSLSDDKSMAYIEIKPPDNGGQTPTLDDFERALANRGICHGVNASVLERLAQSPLYEEKILVALGKKPVHGKDGSYSFLFNTEKNFKPKELPDGTIDYYDLDIVENVSQDQLLCLITPPTEGTAGRSVTNQKISCRKGKPVPSMIGRNTRLSDDGTSIMSNIDGQVVYDGRKINVDKCLRIENVDYSTGNVHVNGNLFVQGIVQKGLSVEAGGNVEIKGTVASASLTASGNIILRSGITGSNLHCDGDLTSRFIENCTVFAKGSIHAEYILNSKIQCGKCLQINGPRSKFLGGNCLVGQNIVSRDIGSPVGIKTEIELGTNPEIIERQQEIKQLLAMLEEQNQSVKFLIDIFQQLEAANRLLPDKKKIYENILAKRDENRAKINFAKEELEKINETILTKGFGRIICSGTIYPGTHIQFGKASMTVTDTLQNTSIYYADGEIRLGSAL